MNLDRTTSRDTGALANRIAANNAFGSADLGAWLLDRLPIAEGTRLLDLGCGTATHLIRMAQSGAICTGVDISASSLATAGDAARTAGVSIAFEHAGMDALPAFNEPFDLITSLYALYYASDAKAVLRQALSLLKPDGALAIFGPYDDNNQEWFDFIAPFLTLNDSVLRSTSRFMPDEVLPFALDHFEKVTCERFVNAIAVPSLDELRRYWQSNIYYDEAADPAFEAAARAHFDAHETFEYRKVGQLVLMQNRFR